MITKSEDSISRVKSVSGKGGNTVLRVKATLSLVIKDLRETY